MKSAYNKSTKRVGEFVLVVKNICDTLLSQIQVIFFSCIFFSYCVLCAAFSLTRSVKSPWLFLLQKFQLLLRGKIIKYFFLLKPGKSYDVRKGRMIGFIVL